ncbi:jg3801 [Pararge aegeria aegeria]|uniref:V-type proton ATPase subunit a n=1 Tax=Pararge aegeria aegeria TaxID=348720 RepID=A0A8S4RPV4_9NEOP|nr:jg3801 [Pararge aegeria aegeria]
MSPNPGPRSQVSQGARVATLHGKAQCCMTPIRRTEDIKHVARNKLHKTAECCVHTLISNERLSVEMMTIYHLWTRPRIVGRNAQADKNASDLLLSFQKASGSPIPSFLHHVPTREIPPTFNRTNKFTRGFQTLIDSYGIASYREVNPALYTIITFPFLFAVMFGDIGHGIIMTVFAAILVIFEKKFAKTKTDNEIWNIFFGGRYIILLMGIFSMYTGLIYNDMFSKSLNLFGSSWSNVYDEHTLNSSSDFDLDPKVAYSGTPYPMGLDPAWQVTAAKVVYRQDHIKPFSFKSTSYHLQFSNDPALGTSCAPSVLIIFINMMLLKGAKDKEPCKAMMYDGQDTIQKVFLAVAFLCIPVMLFGKPVYQLMAAKKNRRYQQGVESGEVVEEGHGDGFGELMIVQGIHTIEYVLGCVSHTASYLRLWALSLAHAQLSAVLWQRLLKMGLGAGSPTNAIVLYVIFAMWAFFTLAILVLMEGLSAFLHTLRLHWVEFMSKFYDGQGYAFFPFSFSAILENDEDDVKDKPNPNGGPPE